MLDIMAGMADWEVLPDNILQERDDDILTLVAILLWCDALLLVGQDKQLKGHCGKDILVRLCLV